MSHPIPDPVTFILAVPGLVQVIAHTCRLIKDLQDTVKGAKSLLRSLESFALVLEDIYDLYRKLTSNTIPATSKSIINLNNCIRDCRGTILEIDQNIKKVTNAKTGTKTLRAWWEESALKGLKEDLEHQKGTLRLRMDALKLEHDTRSRNSSFTSFSNDARLQVQSNRSRPIWPSDGEANLSAVPRYAARPMAPAVLMIGGIPTTNPDLQEIFDAVGGVNDNPFSRRNPTPFSYG